MANVDILGTLAPMILMFVVAVIALEIIKAVFLESTVKGFIRAFFEGLNGGENKENVSRRKEPKVKESENNETSFTEKLIKLGGAYRGNEFLMSPTERDVYKVLEKAYGDKYYIFAQVRVVDVIQPNINKYYTWTGEYKALFRQISQWHFDYVMCNKNDFSIFCALELDDPSHRKPERIRRDRILNDVCSDAGVSLKRMSLNHKKKKLEVVSYD